jgi:hypothetical protein
MSQTLSHHFGARPLLLVLALTALTTIAGAQIANAADEKNPGGCKVVELKPGEQPPSGAMSSTVTAGGGKVTGSTTGGNSVSVHSGNGSTSSTVTTGSSSDGKSTTTVMSSNGECTVYKQSK